MRNDHPPRSSTSVSTVTRCRRSLSPLMSASILMCLSFQLTFSRPPISHGAYLYSFMPRNLWSVSFRPSKSLLPLVPGRQGCYLSRAIAKINRPERPAQPCSCVQMTPARWTSR